MMNLTSHLLPTEETVAPPKSAKKKLAAVSKDEVRKLVATVVFELN